ncbi:hypothetical protein JTE90_011278 [Oedothorax gibbosus]|uniref:Peptidoglycan-recognition protein n=1 Tax=Oedothorax gibbosus TaxID=931172 RepID=A0AAV6TWY1_9ARAC|nr:hypothetical protein JTE90_011278 [Oedothorax gibbosus]
MLDRMIMRYVLGITVLFLLSSVNLLCEGTNGSKEDPCKDMRLVSRKEWNARDSMRMQRMHIPLSHVIISHTVTPFCPTRIQCSRWVELIQDMHLDERGWSDIGYNFLIGGDGSVYEGRGWLYVGAHAVNYNTISYGVAFIGNFNKDKPTQPMIDAAQNLMKCGIKLGYLTPMSEVHGHRDVACTESPGKNLYSEIRHWKNFKGGRLSMYYCKKLETPEVNKDILNE